MKASNKFEESATTKIVFLVLKLLLAQLAIEYFKPHLNFLCMKIKIPIIVVLLFMILQSCKEETADFEPSEVTATDSLNSPEITEITEITDEPEDAEIDIIETALVYPKTGNQASDFLPTLGNYEIQHEATGDLNKDGKADIAVVFVHKKVQTAPRPMLILLQNADKSYRLDKISTVAFPIEYNDFDFKMYDTEDIAIENGELAINLYGMGPSGTFFGSFKYIGNDFILTYIEASFRGAGASTGIVYDLTHDQITVNETNMMDEDATTVTTTSKTTGKRYLFENTSLTDFFNEE